MDKEKKYLLLNWILLTSYGCLNFFALYASVYSWPTQGSVIWFLLIIFCPLFLYQFTFIGHAVIKHEKLQWKIKCRLITLVFGILLAGGLLQMTQKNSLRRFETAYSYLIVNIRQKMPSPCDGYYFGIPQVDNYNHSVSQKVIRQGKLIRALYYDAQRFVLYFRAGSVDDDNSTLFYDSVTNRWQFFHNDNTVNTQQFAARIIGLKQCAVF